jgi:hypothetical protein
LSERCEVGNSSALYALRMVLAAVCANRLSTHDAIMIFPELLKNTVHMAGATINVMTPRRRRPVAADS